jgi:hypothetical protein
MDFVKGLMLGLASGAVCAAYCGPILVPYLLSKGGNILSNLLTILYFMAGRLAGYLLFAVLAWAAGMAAAASIRNEKAVFGVIYIVLAGLMIFFPNGVSGRPRFFNRPEFMSAFFTGFYGGGEDGGFVEKHVVFRGVFCRDLYLHSAAGPVRIRQTGRRPAIRRTISRGSNGGVLSVSGNIKFEGNLK